MDNSNDNARGQVTLRTIVHPFGKAWLKTYVYGADPEVPALIITGYGQYLNFKELLTFAGADWKEEFRYRAGSHKRLHGRQPLTAIDPHSVKHID